MPCYSPIPAWRSRESGITFNKAYGYADRPVDIPCGQCIGCRLEYARQWAIRAEHETKMHKENCFITLTYSPENLPQPEYPTLDKTHFVKFMKRLRKSIEPKRVRYMMCGEYGEKGERPHYHAILFGHDFLDKKLWKIQNEHELFVSEILSDLWGQGFCTVGTATFESCGYVARYVLKKAKGEEQREEKYTNSELGMWREPEYMTTSRRPGIGAAYYEKYKKEIKTNDSIIVRGHECSIPRYYSLKWSEENAKGFSKARGKRVQQAKKHEGDQTPQRLKQREQVKQAQITQLKREI